MGIIDALKAEKQQENANKAHEKAHSENEELKKLKLEVEKEHVKGEELTHDLKRLQAEFENFQKRQDKEKGEFKTYSKAVVVKEFLEILDSLEQGISHHEKSQTPNKELVHDLKLLHNQFTQVMKRLGVKEIKSVGEKFDPDMHECMMHDHENGEEGKITEEFQKGYTIDGKLLRSSKVKVGKRSEEKNGTGN